MLIPLGNYQQVHSASLLNKNAKEQDLPTDIGEKNALCILALSPRMRHLREVVPHKELKTCACASIMPPGDETSYSVR